MTVVESSVEIEIDYDVMTNHHRPHHQSKGGEGQGRRRGGTGNNGDDDNLSTCSSLESQESLDFFASGDLSLSILSNTIFLLAGSFYMIVGLWDALSSTSTFERPSVAFRVYTSFRTLGPFTYLINSIIDIRLANRIRKRRKNKRTGHNGDEQQLQQLESRGGETTDASASTVTTLTRTTQNTAANSNNRAWRKANKALWRKVRKHAAHRRNLYAALAFFFAALTGSASMVVELTRMSSAADGIDNDGDEQCLACSRLDNLSIHSYMLSAILAMFGSGIVMKGYSLLNVDFGRADSLENAGDALFFIGSLVDVILLDEHFDDEVPWWSIFSAFLWCSDACFYLRSDYISRRNFESGDLHVLLRPSEEEIYHADNNNNNQDVENDGIFS